MMDLDNQILRGRALDTIAKNRSLVLSTYEIGFRDEFEFRKSSDARQITLIYTRIDKASGGDDGFSIRVHIIPEYSSVTSMKGIVSNPGEPVEPHHLAEQLHKYLRDRVHNSGLLILAIDRVHLLSVLKRRVLVSLLHSIDQRFAVILLMPEQDWDMGSYRDQYQFDEFIKSIPIRIRYTEDMINYLIDHGESIDPRLDSGLPF